MTGLWTILRTSILAFIAHGALSRGAAISFYTVTSMSPILLIVIGVAGLAFGQAEARNSIIGELRGVMGPQSAELVQSILASASDPASGIAATTFGLLMVIATASGVFGEMQAALNQIWEAKPPQGTLFSMVRARVASLGLVAALGFLLIVSLTASAALTALGRYGESYVSGVPLILTIMNGLLSVAIFSVLFAAIYKVLSDVEIAWRDTIVGAFVTAAMFTLGKSLIGWYLGAAAPASGYGAAGALLMILLWTYYSAQIFLFGAEVTKAIADRRQPTPGRSHAFSAERDLTTSQTP